MATDTNSIDHILELARLGERLTVRKMFGEYTLYLDGKVVAFVCDNSLYIKPSKAAATLAPGLPLTPPYPGAKDYPVADELLDDPELLQRLIVETAALMPPPKEKKPPKPRGAKA